VRSEDAVSNRIGQLDSRAQQLGAAFGIPYSGFLLNDMPKSDANDTLSVISAVATALVMRAERVSLERRNNRWGLYFTREPALVGQEARKAESVPLKDAPLDVRERFLVKSEEFFRAYFKLCEDRLKKMHASVSAADRTLALLDNLRLE
jgi:hypothetical protein